MHGNIPYLFDFWANLFCSSPSTKELHGETDANYAMKNQHR